MSRTKVFIFLLCLIVGVSVGRLFPYERQIIEKTVCVTDTLLLTVIDTVFVTRPVYIESKVTDTVYLFCRDTVISLPIEQKHYSKAGVYDAWVSGYEARLDSIMTYNNTEYKTVTNTVTNTVERKRTGLYATVGVNRMKGSIMESVGLTLTTKGRWLFSAEVGEMNGKVFYGGKVGYKLN